MTTTTKQGRIPPTHNGASHEPDPDAGPGSVRVWHLVTLSIVLALIALVRLRLLAVPFERDEGEYAYVGNLILNGGLPYRDAYNMKLPGTYGMYALFIAVFGHSPAQIHTGLLVASIVTAVCLFVAFGRLFRPTVGLVAASVFSLLSVSMPFMGFAAHATHFINFFLALGLLAYAGYDRKGRWWIAALAGLMAGMAFLMKQQAAAFIVMVTVAVLARGLLARPVRWATVLRHTLACGTGAVLPYLGLLVAVTAAGIRERFWLWTVSYAATYEAMPWAPAVQAGDRWNTVLALFSSSFSPMFAEYPALWLAAAGGVVAILLSRYSAAQRVFAGLLAAGSVAAVSAGLYFRPHYFVAVAPAVGLLAALGLDAVASRLPARWHRGAALLPVLVVVLSAVAAVVSGQGYYLHDSPDAISKQVYGVNPFVEAPEIGRYLAEHSAATDTIAVLGSEPEVLVYSGRRSATGYVYVYPLFELQLHNLDMQREMISEIERNRPRYVVYCNVPSSWLVMPGAPTELLEWSSRYLAANYDVVGLVDLPPDRSSARSYWDSAAQRQPEFENFVVVFRRKIPTPVPLLSRP